MIPDSTLSPQAHDWKVALSHSFSRVEELLSYCELDATSVPLASTTNFPFRVTRFYAALIRKGDPSDPLLLQVLPDAREQQAVEGYHLDAVGDHAAKVAQGLIHKYQGRALLTLSPACAIHCRYCFRRHFPYTENIADISRHGSLMTYLADDTQISEVILSGGDPLMTSDDKLLQLIQNLNALPHIRRLRIHSRLLSVLPERFNDTLLSTLKQFHGKVVLVSHINHANEINDINRDLFLSLQQQGFALFNQSVLLKRINDDAEELALLSYALFDCSITPYYLHRLDKVHGAAHFDISVHQACEIYRNLQSILPGYLLPRLVEEIPGQSSKSTVHCG